MFSCITVRYGLVSPWNKCLQPTRCHRLMSSKVNFNFSNDSNTENSQTLHTIKDNAAVVFKAAKDGRLSHISVPILGPECTQEEAQICCSAEWKLKKNYELLRKAEDEGRLILPLRMPSSEEKKKKSKPSALHFPSGSTIVTYLKQHPLTSDPYLAEENIIQAVAEFFGDQDNVEQGITMGVMLTLYDLNEKLGLCQSTLAAIQMNLTAALMDCAKGKKFRAATEVE